MSPAWIRVRKHPPTVTHPKGHTTYQVLYRRGGRAFKTETAGSFKPKRDAELRRDLVAGWLAQGLDPRVELERLHTPSVEPSFADWYDRFIATRIDATAKTLAGFRNARDTLGDLAATPAHKLAPADFRDWITAHKDLAPATLRAYLNRHAQVLDFANVDPNPARNKNVKLPSQPRVEVVPPAGDEWQRIRAAIRPRLLLAFRLMECCALRGGEIRELELGDVDFVESRLRISKARTKGGTAGQRWIPVPGELMDEIVALHPHEDRERDRRVFTLAQSALRDELARACRDAGTVHYSPHKLRHRRVSLWFSHGFDEVTISRWAGHSDASLSMDVYGHVLVSGDDEWRAFWLDAYARQRGVRAAERADVLSEPRDD